MLPTKPKETVTEYIVGNQQILREALNEFMVSNTRDVAGAAFVSCDGLVITSQIHGHIDPERVAAMTAALVGIMSRVGAEFHIGATEEALILAEDGMLIIRAVSPLLVLVVLLSVDANLGWARRQLRKISSCVAPLVG